LYRCERFLPALLLRLAAGGVLSPGEVDAAAAEWLRDMAASAGAVGRASALRAALALVEGGVHAPLLVAVVREVAAACDARAARRLLACMRTAE